MQLPIQVALTVDTQDLKIFVGNIFETAKINAEKTMIEAEANAHKMATEYEGIKLLYSVKEYANVKKMETIGPNTDVIYYNDQLPLFMQNKN